MRDDPRPGAARHPTLFEPGTLLLGAGLALLGAVIGMELLTRVGITPNSSVIGAVLAIAVSRLPLAAARRFRSVERQNLLQTVVSAATFGGANAVLLPAGAVWLFGRPDLVPAMVLGAVLGSLVDILLLCRLFGSRLFPAEGLWPAGVATAECLRAGDERGARARWLGLGALLGAGARAVGIPADIIGVCWIGNPAALTAFGIGLVFRAEAPARLGFDLAAEYAPHGVMIGAGAVALWQMAAALFVRRRGARKTEPAGGTLPAPPVGARVFAGGFAAFALAAALVAVLAGLLTGMGAAGVLAFAVFAATAALVSELLVGLSAMHAGWFPAFATSLMFLLLGMLLGFPPVALVLLTGFASATGPAFADLGYDLKAGFLLRGAGRDPAREAEGRRAQRAAEVFGLLVASLLVLFTYESYFRADLFPPYDRVAVAAIAAGAAPGLAGKLALWAVPGALLQWAGGRSRQLGVLFATGLLILNPAAGWTALGALLARRLLRGRFGEGADSVRQVLAGGLIAGSALASFAGGAAAGWFRPRG